MDRRDPRRRSRSAYAFAPLLDALAALRISSTSVPSLRPTAAAAALPASFTALPARLPRVPSPPLVNPCSASGGQSRRRGDRDELGDERTLQQLDKRISHARVRGSPSSAAAAFGHRLRARRPPRSTLAARLACTLARRLLSHRDRSCGLGFARSTHATRVRIREWLDRLSLCSKRTRPRRFTATNMLLEKREFVDVAIEEVEGRLPGFPRVRGRFSPLSDLPVGLFSVHHPNDRILARSGEVRPHAGDGHDFIHRSAVELHPRTGRIRPRSDATASGAGHRCSGCPRRRSAPCQPGIQFSRIAQPVYFFSIKEWAMIWSAPLACTSHLPTQKSH